MRILDRPYVLIAIVAALIASAGVYAYTSAESEVTLASLEKCFVLDDQGPDAGCLRAIIPTLLESYATGDILRYSISDAAPKKVQNSCHAIAHIVGEKTFENTGSLELALARCTSDCRYGCMHGALGAAVFEEIGQEYPDEDIAHADVETIRAIGKKYCAQSSTLCHGIGHILYIRSEAYPEALLGCDAIATSYNREMCYQGVFMESLGSSESLLVGSTTNVPKNINYGYPCKGMEAKYQHACFFYLPLFEKVLFDRDNMQNGEERFSSARSVCEGEHGSARSYCILGLSYFVGAKDIFSLDPLKASTTCERFPTGKDQDACIVGSVLHFEDDAEHKKSVWYCHVLPDHEERSLCYNVAFQAMEWAPMQESDITSVCAASETANECESEFARYRTIKNSLPIYRIHLP